MSDTSAQPTNGLARRFVGDSNSTIGSLIKRGFTGKTSPASPLDLLEEAIEEAKNMAPAPLVDQVPTDPTLTDTSLSDSAMSADPVASTDSAIPTNPVVLPISAPDDVLPSDPVAEGVMTQAMPQAVAAVSQAVDIAQQGAGTSRKEAGESVSLEQFAADAARGVQVVETEPTPEISPEVESYLEKVQENKDLAPPEIVIADTSKALPVNNQFPSQPVIVLPITPEVEKVGAVKSPQLSIRWLVEWSRRLMKAFVGKIIYRPIEGNTAS